MKLLFLSQYFPPETGAGATRAVTLRKYLAEMDWEVDVLCEMPNYPSGVIPKEYKGRFSHVTKDDKGSIIRTWVIPTRRENFLQQIGMFASFMFSSFIYGAIHPHGYDAVYATSPPIFGAITGLLLSKLYRVPFFFEVRDLWPDAALETGHIRKSNLSYKISKRIERWLYRRADLVIPVTHRSEELILETCPQAETFVIYNGVDIDHFTTDNALSKIDEKIDKDSFNVGYVGTIGVIHDLETVIKAAKILEKNTDIKFYIIGDGSRSHHLKKLLDEYKLSNIQWLGIKPHDQIPAYLSALDIGLNPVYRTRVFESIITVKFFEYLACEVPVISMAKGVLEQVGDASGAAVTIPPENPELLAETILSLKNNPEKRALMKKNSRPFVKLYFDRKKWAGVLSDTLQARLNRSDDKPPSPPSINKVMSQSGFNW